MRTIMMTLTLLIAGTTLPAMAYGPDCPSNSTPDDHIVAISEVSRSLEDLGYLITEIEAENGCYAVRAVNDSGYPIKAIFDQATGELLWARLREIHTGDLFD